MTAVVASPTRYLHNWKYHITKTLASRILTSKNTLTLSRDESLFSCFSFKGSRSTRRHANSKNNLRNVKSSRWWVNSHSCRQIDWWLPATLSDYVNSTFLRHTTWKCTTVCMKLPLWSECVRCLVGNLTSVSASWHVGNLTMNHFKGLMHVPWLATSPFSPCNAMLAWYMPPSSVYSCLCLSLSHVVIVLKWLTLRSRK